MSVGIGIEVKFRATRKAFSNLEKKQFPFALARALTRTAQDGQSAIRARTKRAFDLRGKYTLRNLRVKPAKKADVVNLHAAYSEVYTDKRIPYMPQHEPGDIKKAKESRNIAVPMRGIKSKRYRTSRGTKKQYLPSTLIGKSIVARGSRSVGPRPAGKGRSKQKNVFVIRSKRTGVRLMVRRKTVKAKPLEFLWAFVPRARIKPSWRFEQTIKQRVSRTFNKHFRRSMARAVATAR